jgi:hypothetical protein
MTYKDILMHRYRSVAETPVEPVPLDYLAFRNLQSLRAWQRRRCATVGNAAMPHHRAWLKTWWRSAIQPEH